MMSGLLLAAVQGVQGIPLPYSPRMDDGVAAVLLACFFMSAYVLSRSRKFLLQLVKDFLLNRERTSIFDTSTSSDMRYLLLLIFQTCVMSGVCLFNYFTEVNPLLIAHLRPFSLLVTYIGVSLLYLFFKWLLYSVIGWIFFNNGKVTIWFESYSTLLYYLGFSLFLLSLFVVYFNLDLKITLIIGAVLAVFLKILIFYKWLKLFCEDLHGALLLILYFCALEIVPCLMWYRGLVHLNDLLIIKF